MNWRRWCTALGTLLVAFALAAPAAAGDGQRRPQGQSGSSSRAQVRQAQPAPSSPPPRVAVPRSTQDRNTPQRRPDADGVRRPGGGSGGHSHYPYYRGQYSWYPWGWWGWWGGWWGPWYHGGYYPPVAYYPDQLSPNMGALDLDLRPEKVQVWLNGTPIGVADNFDGWPRYLWLEEGTYDLVFYHPGYETLARQYTIYPGVVIDVEDTMVKGDAVPPEELISTSTERRDERLRRREERGEAADGREPPDWRDRVRAEREAMEDQPYVDTRAEPARLRLEVRPADASVYLDGRFIGVANDLARARAALIVEPGEHELEVVRPGYASKSTTFTAEVDEEVELTVELEAEP